MCTSILVRYKDGVVMGRNMDYEHPIGYNVLYLPPGYHYAEDLYGNPMKNKYKMMGVCFLDHNPLKDGVNEHGLIGCTNTFRVINPFAAEVDPEKYNLSSLDFMNHALGNYRNVPELVADLENLHISHRNSRGDRIVCPEFHYFFADAEGNSVVLEPENRKLTAFENPFDVMTNSPSLGSHERRLRKLMDPDRLEDFNSVKGLPGGYDPVSRFIKAFYLTKTHVPSEDGYAAIEAAYSILESLKMPQGFVKLRGNPDHSYTRYMCAYDTQKRLLTVRSHTNSAVFSLSFDQIEDPAQRLSIEVEQRMCLLPFESIGDV